MPDFDFVGPSYTAASLTQEAQECINWYVEADQMKFSGSPSTNVPEQRGYQALYPTPGLVTRLELLVGEVRGFHVRSDNAVLYAVSGNTLYSIVATGLTTYSATVVDILLSSTGRVYMDDNGAALYITDGTSRYSYIWGTSTFAIQNDGAFTNGNVCFEVDNFIVYNRPGTSQWGCTDAGAVTSNPLNLGSKLIASDNIVSLIPDHRQVILLGERTSERWVNVGTFPFPFAVVPGTSMQHGLAAQNSVARLGEGVAYLAQDERGNATVISWGATATNPTRISTFAVENAIQSYSVTSDAIAYTYSQSGHEFYMLTFPTADVTWCFDLATQMWHKRAWRDDQNVLHRHRSNCAALFNGEVLVGDWQNGKVYAFSQTVFTDDGDLIPCIRRAPHLTNDLKRQYFHDLQIQFQPGVGLQTGQGSNPECILRLSNDGGFTFGNDHILTIGTVGQYKHRAIKRRLGYARDRVFEIEVTDPVYRVVVSSNLNASGGIN